MMAAALGGHLGCVEVLLAAHDAKEQALAVDNYNFPTSKWMGV